MCFSKGMGFTAHTPHAFVNGWLRFLCYAHGHWALPAQEQDILTVKNPRYVEYQCAWRKSNHFIHWESDCNEEKMIRNPVIAL